MKIYTFTYEELVVLREALAEYKYLLHTELGDEVSERRAQAIRVTSALYEQFRDDIRLYKGNV